MAFTRIKKIQDKEYKYLVKNIRVGKKVIQKVVKYIGPVSPIYHKKHKTNTPKIFVRKLADEETGTLDKSTKSNSAFTKDRAKIIILSSQGLDAKTISGKINCEIRKVREAIKSFNNKGLVALQRGKARGAKPKFTDVTKKIILMHFSKTPMSFDYHFTTWTLPRFAKHLIGYKVVDSISIEKVRQILDEAGARLKRSKRWQYSPDKEFDKKNKE